MIAGGNLVLVLLIGLVCFQTVVGGTKDPKLMPPDEWTPLNFQVDVSLDEGGSVDSYQPVWAQFDRAQEVVTVDTGPNRTGEVAPPPQQPITSSDITLIMVNQDLQNPKRSSFIANVRGQQQTFAVDDNLGAMKVVSIEVEGEGIDRRAIVVLAGGGQERTLRLQVSP